MSLSLYFSQPIYPTVPCPYLLQSIIFWNKKLPWPHFFFYIVKRFVLIAGDISPIDVITHVPVICEEASVPYCYVPSKEDLGAAGATKRPTSVVMVGEKGKTGEAVEGFMVRFAFPFSSYSLSFFSQPFPSDTQIASTLTDTRSLFSSFHSYSIGLYFRA